MDPGSAHELAKALWEERFDAVLTVDARAAFVAMPDFTSFDVEHLVRLAQIAGDHGCNVRWADGTLRFIEQPPPSPGD